ncbi:hypothetical protein Aperf_G00000023739 [Anoplocephala perfoliata]
MRLRQRLSYTLMCILLFALVILVVSRMVNLVELFDEDKIQRKLLVIDLDRDKIPSLWNQGLTESIVNQPLSTNGSLPIAFHNVSDVLWSSSRGKIVSDPSLLRRHIHQVNEVLVIRNSELFGESPFLFIIIIQVHDRFTHLMYLIESLRKVRGIEDALLVFSHDFFSPEANRMIDAVQFVRFTQIFYPYTLQLFPNSFPGHDPRDCRNRGDTKCLNHEWPDIAGNFRNPNFTQVKHHWIWKLCFVMERMNIVRNFTGWYILLEEDYVVLPDMLHVLRLTKQHNSTPLALGANSVAQFQVSTPSLSLIFYDMVTLGSYENRQSFNSPELVYTSSWSSSNANMGMAFQRRFFDKLKPCLKTFCLYDDYNWDWSLSYIDRTCLAVKIRVLHFKNCGRVFHTGSCGLHAKSSNCDNVEYSIKQVMKRTVGRSGEGLFPTSLNVLPAPVRRSSVRTNGGWGDPRDRGLCLAIIADRWAPLALLLPSDSIGSRKLDIFEPLIPGVSDTQTSVL